MTYLSNFLSVLCRVLVLHTWPKNSEWIAKIIRLPIVTELTLSKMVVVCCVLLCSVCSFLHQFLTNLPFHAQYTSHFIVKDITLNWIKTCIPEDELEIPYLLSEQRMIEMEITMNSIAIFVLTVSLKRLPCIIEQFFIIRTDP